MASAPQSEFNGRLQEIVKSAGIAVCMVLGSKLGLYKPLADLAPCEEKAVGSIQFADAVNCKERYIREWLRSLAAVDIIGHVIVDGFDKFYLSDWKAQTLFEQSKWAELMVCCAKYQNPVVDCFPKDGPLGTDVKSYDDFHHWLGGQGGVFADVNVMKAMVEDMELTERLNAGGLEIVDLGCGSAKAIKSMAQQYPNNTFYAVEQADELLEQARKNCKGLSNVKLVASDACELPADWTDKFHLVMMFDVLHDCSYPDKLLSEVRRICKQDGGFFFNDIDFPSDLTAQKKLVDAAMFYMVSIHYCMATSLAREGGAGLGTCVGVENLIKMIKKHGFSNSKQISAELGCFYHFTNRAKRDLAAVEEQD